MNKKSKKSASRLSDNINACVYAPPPDLVKNTGSNTGSNSESQSQPKRKIAPVVYDDDFGSGLNINVCVYAPPPDIDVKNDFDAVNNIAPDVYGPPPDLYPPDEQESQNKESGFKNWFRRKWLKK